MHEQIDKRINKHINTQLDKQTNKRIDTQIKDKKSNEETKREILWTNEQKWTNTNE